jgi:hypothetical protein
MIQIPNNTKQFIQNNRSNLLGNLWSTKGIDLQANVGAIRSSSKLLINTNSADDAQLGTPWAFEFFDGRWWAVCEGSIFKNSSEELTGSFSEDASTGAITSYSVKSDLKIFNGRLWATAAGKLYSKATNSSGTGAWTDRTGSAGVSGSLAQMAYLRKLDRLYWVESSDEIASISTGDVLALTGDYNLDLGTSGLDSVCALSAGSDRLWIGLMVADNNASSSGGRTGSIIEWDGVSNQITREYKIQAAGVASIVVDPDTDIPYAIDSNGSILKFTGYGFSEIGRLPVGYKHLLSSTASLSSTGRHVHHNGFVFSKDHTLLVAVRNTNEDNGATVNENLPSGIWEFDLNTYSFTHKHSFTLQSDGSDTITDYGQNRIVSVGAISINPFANDSTGGSCSILSGATYYTSATATASAIFIDSPDSANTDTEGQKTSYFVTNWVEAPLQSADEKWQKVFSYYKQFLGATDKLVIKYRTIESAPTEIAITWVNTTSFTTTTNVSAMVGYEVEGIQGTGAGSCSHIVSVVNNAGTYTVTVDETITGVTTGTAKVRLQNWIKAGYVSNTDEVASTPIDKNAPRIQVKVYMLVTGKFDFYKLKLINEVNQIAQ